MNFFEAGSFVELIAPLPIRGTKFSIPKRTIGLVLQQPEFYDSLHKIVVSHKRHWWSRINMIVVFCDEERLVPCAPRLTR